MPASGISLAGSLLCPGGATWAGQPRAPLGPGAGLSPAYRERKAACLSSFESWLHARHRISLEQLAGSGVLTGLALAGFGHWLHDAGHSIYDLRHALLAVKQRCPELGSFLAPGWGVLRRWEQAEPPISRTVAPPALVRAMLCIALLWGWPFFAVLLGLGMAGMLRVSEVLGTTRADVVLPSDRLEAEVYIFVRIREPKTKHRFARYQHARVSDGAVIALCSAGLRRLPLEARISPYSYHAFGTRWRAICDALGLGTKAGRPGPSPGSMRGSGATHFYMATAYLPRPMWRGRWRSTTSAERYLQEATAQAFLGSLPSAVRTGCHCCPCGWRGP